VTVDGSLSTMSSKNSSSVNHGYYPLKGIGSWCADSGSAAAETTSAAHGEDGRQISLSSRRSLSRVLLKVSVGTDQVQQTWSKPKSVLPMRTAKHLCRDGWPKHLLKSHGMHRKESHTTKRLLLNGKARRIEYRRNGACCGTRGFL